MQHDICARRTRTIGAIFASAVDEPVDIREADGRIVIEPIRPRKYDLSQLLAGITKENLHGEVSFGKPTGKEAL